MSGESAPEGDGLGWLLRRYRLASGLSQEELAERAGLSVRAIANIERGQTSRPYRRSVQLLADGLRLPEPQREQLERASRAIADDTFPRGPAAGGIAVPAERLPLMVASQSADAGPRSAATRKRPAQLAQDERRAHVQRVTATIRTLVIGTHQVTLSVYAQLDECPAELIQPFGRVRPRAASRWHTYVVGRINRQLARSSSLSERAWQQGKRTLYGETAHLDVGNRRYVIPSNVDRQEALAALATEWEKLPLIVLTGLR